MRNGLLLALLVSLGSTVPIFAGEPVADRGAEATRAPELAADAVDAWRTYLVARSDEDAWRRIPWSTTLADGIVRANTAAKPLLLWVMNGHPLGCT